MQKMHKGDRGHWGTLGDICPRSLGDILGGHPPPIGGMSPMSPCRILGVSQLFQMSPSISHLVLRFAQLFW